MTDRDHFAAAALTGLLVHANDDIDEETMDTPSDIAYTAYQMADAMLRERGKEQGHEDNRSQPSKRKWVHGCTGILRDGEVGMEETDDGPVYKIGDGKTEWDDLPTLVKSTNHDDAATGEPSGGVGFSSGSRTGTINRTPERQSPDRECGESALRDVPQLDNSRAAGGPEHHISEAEIDALEFVVEEGRIANIHDYGILRSLLIRLRQEWEFRPEPYGKSDEKRGNSDTKRCATPPRNCALSGCETVPDPGSRVWETPCTQHPHATPQQGSVQGEGSMPRSGTENEPVAWAVMAGDWFHDVRLSESGAKWYASYLNDKAGKEKCRVVPLYRHQQPTLTAEEREAVEQAIDAASGMAPAEPWAIATLRKLLERLA